MLCTWNSCIVTHHLGQWYDTTEQYRLIPSLTHSCTIDNMKGFVQCTIQNIFIPFSNCYTRVAIHSCMEVPFLHYMACGSSWELCGGTIRWYKLGVLTDVVSCQVIQSGYPGAYRHLQSCVGTRARLSYATFDAQLGKPISCHYTVCYTYICAWVSMHTQYI